MGAADIEAVWRIESARIVAALTRFTGDFGLAEDAAQEAVTEALMSWPRAAPANPAGWLMATAQRRAIDAIRRRTALQDRYALLAAGPAVDGEIDPDRIDDDVLALMFISCHPVLSREARVALTLRVVGGLSSQEIARAFLIPVPTVQARITRAKKTIAAAGVPFELPAAGDRRERLGGVLSVLYVIFTEGSTAASGDRLLRPDVAYEAISPVMLSRTAVTRLLASTAVTAAAVGSLLGIAGPAAAAGTVTVNLTLDVSGAYVVGRTPLPVNSVDLRIFNSAGVQIARDCVLQADPGSDDIDRRTITPAGGYDVSVPTGGKVEGRPAVGNCWFQEPAAAPTVFQVGSIDAAVAWYLHP